jgi:hypothetical protein
VAETSSGNVYVDSLHMGDSFIRLFDESVDSEELVWHRDKRDRMVEVISGTGWKFQYDNNMPFELKTGMRFYVGSQSYHRLLKGKTELLLRITEQ